MVGDYCFLIVHVVLPREWDSHRVEAAALIVHFNLGILSFAVKNDGILAIVVGEL